MRQVERELEVAKRGRGFSLPLLRIRPGVSKQGVAALLFLSPAALIVLLFFVAPVLLTFWISMTNMSVATLGRTEIIGFSNYLRILRSPYTSRILQNTLLYVSATLTFNVGMGLILALLTTHIEERVGVLFRALWLLPRVTPSVVYALLWTWATAPAPFGTLNQVLGPLGLPSRNWLTTQPWGVIILANGFVGASLGMIIFTSAIKAIPPDYIMAAQVDGATTWQIIRRIILPLIRWPIMFVTAYQTLSLLASFEYILLLTEGGPGFYRTEVWALYAYHQALSNYFGNVQFGFGAALAAVLVAIGVVASVIYLRVFRFQEMMSEPKIEGV